jgi:diaminobutyrate-2-oxoglutarate transaminase
MKIIERLESQVRTYSRSFPAVFTTASGSFLKDDDGKEYLDFFCGAGALNYGHNNPRMKQRLIEYVQADGITHSLDMATGAKEAFLCRFNDTILRARDLNYKIQFTGPTGTNAVEAALKLARKVTGHKTVVHFVNSYHGLSLGSLAVIGNISRRNSAGVSLHHNLPMFFDADLGPAVDTLDYFEALVNHPENGVGGIAAVIVETIQAEGGVKVSRCEWLQRLSRITRQHGIILIVDDIQVGCGRTGDFFSFEMAGIAPDIVCLSKSISGYGLPMSLLLIRPEVDLWSPGEHTGTFRGNNLAFITATEAVGYWEEESFGKDIARKSKQLQKGLERIVKAYPEAKAGTRGRGLIYGLVLGAPGLAEQISREAFDRGMLIETCGPKQEVVKLLPPLTISEAELSLGIELLDEAVKSVLINSGRRQAVCAG